MPITSQAARDAAIAQVDAKAEADREAAIAKVLAETEAAAQAARDAETAAAEVASRDMKVAKMQAARGQACARYRAALGEWRAAYVNLAAYDQMLGVQGFGPAVHTMDLRHITATPDTADGGLNPLISGSLQSDIIAIIKSTREKGWLT